MTPSLWGFNLKKKKCPWSLRGSDTVKVYQASTLRAKGVHTHPYCRALRVKMRGALRTFGDLGSSEVLTPSKT